MLCLIFRYLITSAINAGQKPGLFLSGHLRTCQKCKKFYKVSKDVNVRLCRQTTNMHSAYQSYLTEKIVAKLPLSPAGAATGSSTTIKYLFPASAAAIVLLLLGGWYFLQQEKPTKPSPTQNISGISLYDMLSVETVMSGEIVEENMFAEWANWMETPVTLEAKYLTKDAQTATAFLLACLDVDS